MSATNASAKSIDILIVIDTEYVKTNYPNPSQDSSNPTGINHSSQFMICTANSVVSGQGTADLNFKANAGDYVSFRGVSIYQNSDDAVIVYGIKHWSGAYVFNQFVSDVVTRTGAVVPNTTTQNGLPAGNTSVNFTSLDSKISGQGVENFYVYFALYTLANDGETQNLYGYYYWDPAVTVA